MNTSRVLEMTGMFSHISIDTLDLRHFDTSNVTDMSGMFYNSFIANLCIKSFNTRNVKLFNNMFLNFHSQNTLDISSFRFSSMIQMMSFLTGIKVPKIVINMKEYRHRLVNLLNIKDIDLELV